MLKAVLFDLDQTLLDWENVEPWENYQRRRFTNLFTFVNETLHPLEGKNPDALLDAFAAAAARAWRHAIETFEAADINVMLAETLREVGVPEDRIDAESIMQAYGWQPPAGQRAYPDVADVLRQLVAHGVELGIVTNASQSMRYRDRELEGIGLLDLFSPCRLAAVDAGVIKPHPRIFQHALNMLDLDADEAVFVGDNLEADVAGAQGVGMRAVWVARNGANDEPHAGIDPDGTVTTLHDLLPLLDGWYPGWRNGDTP